MASNAENVSIRWRHHDIIIIMGHHDSSHSIASQLGWHVIFLDVLSLAAVIDYSISVVKSLKIGFYVPKPNSAWQGLIFGQSGAGPVRTNLATWLELYPKNNG